MNLHFSYDVFGAMTVSTDPGYRALAVFLESEMQGSIASCERHIQELDRIGRGEQEPLEGVGNALEIGFYPDHVTLREEYVEDSQPLTLSTEAFRTALVQCIEWLQTHPRPATHL